MAPTGWCSWCRRSVMQRRHGASSPRCTVLRSRAEVAVVRAVTLGGRFVRSMMPPRQPLHAQHTLHTKRCDPRLLTSLLPSTAELSPNPCCPEPLQAQCASWAWQARAARRRSPGWCSGTAWSGSTSPRYSGAPLPAPQSLDTWCCGAPTRRLRRSAPRMARCSRPALIPC